MAHNGNGTEHAELLDKRGVAALLSLSPRTISAMLARGELPHVRLSKRCIRFPRQAVLEAMAKRTIGIQ
jgi:excisionase family DNA binding protein